MLERQGLLFGGWGVMALCFCGRRWVAGVGWRVAAAGVGLFGLPILVGVVARGSVGEMSRSSLFALVPVVVALALAAGEPSSGAMRLLTPALAGAGGLYLLLPQSFSPSLRGEIMLGLVVATVAVVGICSVWLYRLLRGVRPAKAMAVVGLANAAFLLGCGAVRSELAWSWSRLGSAASLSSAVDAVEIGLIVWLVREMPPARFAARFLLIPLLTILESFVLARPGWTVRIGFGTALLAAGAGLLLLPREVDDEAVLSLR